jgi:hypothetical protein
MEPKASLTTLPSELRGLIFDHLLSASRLITFDQHYRILNPGEAWPTSFLQTSSEIYADGKAALRRAFRRTTIKYRNCTPILPWYGQSDSKVHYSFVKCYGKLFESMEISRLASDANLSMYPNIRRLIIGRFIHSVPLVYVPKMSYPRFSDILDKDILEAWRMICQYTRTLQARYPMEDLVIDAVDGRVAEQRRFKVFVRLVLEAQTKGVSPRADGLTKNGYLQSPRMP